MRSLKSFSFALTTSVSAISFFIMLAQPSGAGTLSICSHDICSHDICSQDGPMGLVFGSVFRASDLQHAAGDRGRDLESMQGVLGTNGGFTGTLSGGTSFSFFARLAVKAFSTPLSPGAGMPTDTLDSLAPFAAFNSIGISRLTFANSTLAGGPAAPFMPQDFRLSANAPSIYSVNLSEETTTPEGSSGGKKSIASTASDSPPKIIPAPEPDSLAYLAGAGAIGCGLQLRRLRRSRASRGGATAAAA